MDIFYVFRHSTHVDTELRYSLRGVERHLPWAGKVWVFGDRPDFLSEDTSLISHVPHRYVTRIGEYKTPVTNFFLMLFLSSLIPELSYEYLWFCDDFILLNDLSPEDARRNRYLQDLSGVENRGSGLWKESLWRTYDLLERLGYTGYNFETHTPTYLTKRRVFDAYCEFRDFTTQDRWFGMLGPTSILNHAYRRERFPLVKLAEEGRHSGFHNKGFSYDEIVGRCRGKTFLNFDDEATNEDMLRFLKERFPEASKYECGGVGRPTPSADACEGIKVSKGAVGWPAVILPNRGALGEYFNHLGLDGEGVEVGTQRGVFAVKLLETWQGRCLHCVDPWRATDDDGYVDVANVRQTEHERNFTEARRRLAAFGQRHRIHRMTSSAAAPRFRDRSLDFVYLDARHDAVSLRNDLQQWFPKVRPGGLLAGHDYLDGTLPSGVFEVKSTVDTWAAEHGLTIQCTGEHVWRSWLVRVPGLSA